MNILFLTSWYPTKFNPNFGIFVKEHAHSIVLTNNIIVVLAIVINKTSNIYSKTITDTVDESGMRIILIEINSKFKNLLYHLIPFQYRLVKKVFRNNILPDFKPDIIHSNVIFPSGIIGDILALNIKKPHIITEHWSRINTILKKPVLSGMAIKAYQRATMILPVSLFLMNKMKILLPTIDSNKYHIVSNVIDSELFYFIEKKPNKDSIKFCAIATWADKKIPDKKPELFIEALAVLQTQIKETVILTMIGGGDQVSKLQDLCREKSIKANFVGFLNKVEIAKQLQESDFFIHASTIETFGIVIAEALLCGTPVICSNVGALPELINESNGILCENNLNEWVKGLHKLISFKFKNHEIADKNKRKFSKENVSKKINELYKEVSNKWTI
jgi:glycosyltransferase involved in cell wall biosynthesis